MTWFNNIRIAPKLIASFLLVTLLAAVVAGAGFFGLNSVQSKMDTLTNTSTPSLELLLHAEFDLAQALRYTRAALLMPDQASTDASAALAQTARTAAMQDFQRYQALAKPIGTEQRVAVRRVTELRYWTPIDLEVQQLAQQGTAGTKMAGSILSVNGETRVTDALTDDLNQLVQINQQRTITATNAAHMAHTNAVYALVGALVGAVLLALVLGVLFARAIARPLTEVQRVAENLSRICIANLVKGLSALASGDLTVPVTIGTTPPTYQSKDEIGQTAEVMRTIVSSIEQAIAAYEEARAGLQQTVRAVASTAEQVDRGAGQFAQATEQLGQASTQIARAIEDVARGAGEQSKVATEALGQLDDLSSALDHVSAAASSQSAAVARTSTAVEQLGSALQHTTQSVAAVTGAADRAATTAREGGAAVGQTLQSLENVRRAVLKSAAQVQALGRHSEEVGAIVSAISTEEQTAGVAEMSAGAQELAALANQLQEAVGTFVLDAAATMQQAAQATGQVVPRRRAAAWQATPQTKAQRRGA